MKYAFERLLFQPGTSAELFQASKEWQTSVQT